MLLPLAAVFARALAASPAAPAGATGIPRDGMALLRGMIGMRTDLDCDPH